MSASVLQDGFKNLSALVNFNTVESEIGFWPAHLLFIYLLVLHVGVLNVLRGGEKKKSAAGCGKLKLSFDHAKSSHDATCFCLFVSLWNQLKKCFNILGKFLFLSQSEMKSVSCHVSRVCETWRNGKLLVFCEGLLEVALLFSWLFPDLWIIVRINSPIQIDVLFCPLPTGGNTSYSLISVNSF